MNSVSEKIKNLEYELTQCPSGYISRKIINGKERFYYQWLEDGKLKSKYIKNDELESIRALVDRRKELQEQIKALRSTPEGIYDSNQKRKAVRNMQTITGTLMMGDMPIAQIKNGIIVESDDNMLPLYLRRTKNFEGWAAARAIDSHRTNSRLLKKVLRLKTTDDVQTALAVNAATVTDRYWFKPDGSNATYDDVRFKENHFDQLALRGDPDSFSKKPSRTPELTNIGSFEKCWKLIDGTWWMYKNGNEAEYFSELFICKLGEKLGLDMAHYELDGDYIRSKDFTNGASVNFESIRSLIDEDEDYENCFNVLKSISADLAKQYLLIIWMDSICYNMDRHTENFGLLRDVQTGEILSLAPNYDNNIALIAKGYPTDVSRQKDGLIRFFKEFIGSCPSAREMYMGMNIPAITETVIDECINEIPFDVDREYIQAFVLNGQSILKSIIDQGECLEDDEDNELGLTL